ncbi:unnamed protein product [Dovyalis caffra]|uniref:Protein TIFY n=1 Tax=Dovyalis caffra TaxID=77055 RepID=A0AAV1SHH5_9ROSI|nr:unnamed protein product [Dovyalis caffra]
MRRNCDLELRLVPFSDSDHHRQPIMEESTDSPQQLTIFYNGTVCVCDVTELQARAILTLAGREMEDKSRSPEGSQPTSPTLPSQLCSRTGLSMKRSLQRFLQKRKHRIQATSPYKSVTGNYSGIGGIKEINSRNLCN